MNVKLLSVVFLLSTFVMSEVFATVELPFLFSDGAVLQRNETVPVWGKAAAGRQLIVEFAGEKKRVRSDSDGNWHTQFSARDAGGPFRLTVSSGDHSVVVRDIWLGDVWVCSGQSNMEWELVNTRGAEKEIQAAKNVHIRQFKVPLSWSATPADELAGGSWHPATSQFVGNFTGVGYYFAKKVQAETNIPIGLINTSWGGSTIESWMSSGALNKSQSDTTKSIAGVIADAGRRAEKISRAFARWPGAVVRELADTRVVNADWSGEDIDESDWLPLHAPLLWEKQTYNGVDGVIWYRKSFYLNAEQVKSDLILGLGRIDDNDTSWLNGKKIGETRAHDKIRQYRAPADYLHKGKNQIAIRVEDTGGGGGIYSDEQLLYLQTKEGARRSLAGEWKFKAEKVVISPESEMNYVDTALYNKMLHPLFKVPVKGVLWYQGESNAETAARATRYKQQFQSLINDWRAHWRNPELPFYWVQLASFNSGNDTETASPWAILRASQTAALALPNTGQAIALDVGDSEDIHPRDKKTVGYRLARIALSKTYDKKNMHFRGPVLTSHKVKQGKLILGFSTLSRLRTVDGDDKVKSLEISGPDGIFYPVDGELAGNSVVIKSALIRSNAVIRYAWDDNPEKANLADADGLPAEPFSANL